MGLTSSYKHIKNTPTSKTVLTENKLETRGNLHNQSCKKYLYITRKDRKIF